jgi:hypothetical protein
MKNTLRSVSKNLASVSITAALASAIVLHQQERVAPSDTPQVLQAQSLELVDERGRVCVSLKAGKNGGSLQLYSPSNAEGQEGLIAYLGSVFGDDLQFTLREPKPGKSSFNVLINGEPSCPTVSGLGANGTPAFRMGGIGNGNPMLNLWRMNEEEPYYSR